MQPLLDHPHRVSSLRAVRWRSQSLWIRSKGYAGRQCLSVPAGDKRRKEGLIAAGYYPEKVDIGIWFSYGIRVFAPEGVVIVSSLKYLALDFPLVIIPDLAATLSRGQLIEADQNQGVQTDGLMNR
jgi:hypothetical protein